MITCKLTDKKGKPVKAHIIPKSFYEFEYFNNEPYHVIQNDSNKHAKRSPVGIYDKTIVILEGENYFLKLDDYANQPLLKQFSDFKKFFDNGVLIGYQVPNYNYSRLKLFCLSVLWRAHHSSQEFFSKIKLGPHEEIIKKMILTDNAGEAEDYSVFITKWKEEEALHIFLDPHRIRIEGVIYYRIYLGRFFITIKVDKRESYKAVKKIQLTTDSKLSIICQKQINSKAYNLMDSIARAHYC